MSGSDSRSQLREHLRQLRADGLWAVPRAGTRATPAPANHVPDPSAKNSTTDPEPEPVPEPAVAALPSLDELAESIEGCRLCKLCEGRTNIVFGVGNPDARLMFIGEGPGRDEDLKGEPFVGRAGQLLDDIIVQGMGLRREDVYIANTVKCRPPNNRNPEPDELAACRPFLDAQIEAIDPEVIVLLGRVAMQAVLDTDAPLGRMRGDFVDWNGRAVMCTYHPAYLLRSPQEKGKTWADVKMVMRRLGLPVP